jgi:hypothetical protein
LQLCTSEPLYLFSNKKQNFWLALTGAASFFLSAAERKRYSEWQERLVLKKPKISAPVKFDN